MSEDNDRIAQMLGFGPRYRAACRNGYVLITFICSVSFCLFADQALSRERTPDRGESLKLLVAPLCSRGVLAREFPSKIFYGFGITPQPVVMSDTAGSVHTIVVPATRCRDKTVATDTPSWMIIAHMIDTTTKDGYVYYTFNGRLSKIMHIKSGKLTFITGPELAKLEEGDFKEQVEFPDGYWVKHLGLDNKVPSNWNSDRSDSRGGAAR